MISANEYPGENQDILIKEQPKFDFKEFNKFQTYFFTNVKMFDMYTNYEIRNHSVTLLTNIGKAFPELARSILDIYSEDVKAIHSPSIIRALQQHKFVNGFSNPRIPQEIFYKGNKAKPAPKKKAIKRKTAKGHEFTDDVKADIMSLMWFDSKDYEAFKFRKDVQDLGLKLIDSKGYVILDKVK